MKFKDPEDIDRPVMVKFPGARGWSRLLRGLKHRGVQWEKIDSMMERGWITEDDIKDAHIEEYVSGTNFCIHYFYSIMNDEVELMGMDSRFESNIDGLVRIPARDQLENKP